MRNFLVGFLFLVLSTRAVASFEGDGEQIAQARALVEGIHGARLVEQEQENGGNDERNGDDSQEKDFVSCRGKCRKNFERWASKHEDLDAINRGHQPPSHQFPFSVGTVIAIIPAFIPDFFRWIDDTGYEMLDDKWGTWRIPTFAATTLGFALSPIWLPYVGRQLDKVGYKVLGGTWSRWRLPITATALIAGLIGVLYSIKVKKN